MWSQHRWFRAAFVLVALVALGLTAAALGDFSGATDADGLVVLIAVPDPDGDGVVDIAAGNEGEDVILFTGQSLGTTAAGGCDCCDGTAQRQLQAVTVMDPGAGRAARRFDVMAVNQTDPLPPGTRVGDLLLLALALVSTVKNS